jgi:hypothetical protein
MSTIEICVIIVTVVIVFERVSHGLAAWTQVRGIWWLKKEIEAVRAEIGLGASIGGAIGAAIGGVTGARRRQAERHREKPTGACRHCGSKEAKDELGGLICAGCGHAWVEG